MSIVYFTTNADSGDGSLRSAYLAAEEGDVVMPDPNVDWGAETIEIPLASKLELTKNAVFDAGTRRVRLNAQENCVCVVNSSGAEVSFRKFDLVNGGNASGGGCYHSSASRSSALFSQCLFAGGYSGNYGGAIYLYNGAVELRDSVVTGCRASSGGGGIRVYNLAKSFKAVRCTFAGNAVSDVSLLTTGETVYEFSDTLVGTGTGPVETRPPESVGFVRSPPNAIAGKDWTAEMWKEFDLRLRHDSSALAQGVSAAEGDVDLLGNPRRTPCSLGAYEGTWFAARSRETVRIEENIVVDRAEIEEGARVEFGEDASLGIALDGKIGAAAFVGEPRGYLALAPSIDAAAGAFDGVTLCAYGAGVAAFLATADSPNTAALEWTCEVPEIPVLLESAQNGEWISLGSETGGAFTTPSRSGRTRYRVFDGAKFYYDDAWTFSGVQFSVAAVWTTAEKPSKNWEAVVQIASTTAKIAPGQSITILARIFDAFDTDAALLNNGGNIAAVKYSCYFNTNNLFEAEFTPVPGHENVDAGTACVLEGLQTSDAWTLDDAGYNFVLTPNVREYPLFDAPGEYRIKTTIELREGNPIVFYVPVAVEERV